MNILPTLLLVLFPLFTDIPPPPAATHDAMVVMVVDGLEDAQLARLSSQLGQRSNVTIEYSCVWSGVLVMRFGAISVGERADVITIARRQLTEAGLTSRVEFVHVHMEERGVGKC